MRFFINEKRKTFLHLLTDQIILVGIGYITAAHTAYFRAFCEKRLSPSTGIFTNTQ